MSIALFFAVLPFLFQAQRRIFSAVSARFIDKYGGISRIIDALKNCRFCDS